MGVAVDSVGNAYAVGVTQSLDFPTLNAFEVSLSGVSNGFVAKFNLAASGPASLLYSTYLGGSNGDSALGITVDSLGNAYVTGLTTSSDFPTVNAADTSLGGPVDAFVAKLNPAASGGASLLYSTYLGGGGDEVGYGVVVDSGGNCFVVGSTNSSDFPAVNAFDTSFNGSDDAFVVKLSPGPSDNVGPVTSNFVATPNPVRINIGSTLTATVSDTTTGGSTIASAEYSLDGGSFMPMIATDAAFDEVSEDVMINLASFTVAGLHTLCVRGRDAAGAVGLPDCILLVVYDPTGGFVTGGGSVNSSAGADLANPSAAGSAVFGFVSKYQLGQSTPGGNLEFQFKAGNLNFKSTSMDWLVVTGQPRAQFRGTGSINGTTVCKFDVDAWDGSLQPGNVDAFGLRIFSCAGGGDRYNLPATPLIKGSVIIHQ